MRLASQSLNAGVLAALYTVPNGNRTVFTASFCNRSASVAKVSLALTAGGDPTDADWIEFETPIQAAGAAGGSVLERTGLALGVGQKVFVRSDVAGVSVVVFGVQEAI